MKYYILPSEHTKEQLEETVFQHPNIKFVSLVGVDLGNNRTDEKIPVSEFLEDYDHFLEKGIQTDGSSVMLPLIACINDAKVDIIPDTSVKWFIDYSSLRDPRDQSPIGTILIPSNLYHNGKIVGSRGVLQRSVDSLTEELMEIDPEIEEVNLTLATELEFWIYSPFMTKDEESLFVSQELKEQYWKRPIGDLRLAMEECMMEFEKYGLHPEMAHKEVGGVVSTLKGSQSFSHMEQIEIDWKYDTPLQAADNEWVAKNIISDVFYRYGLDVTFKAKPIKGVSGSGKHHHMGITVVKKGKKINLFAPNVMTEDFLSATGYGALMGLLKHYNAVNPFITSSNDAFNRLTPGFEAPVSRSVSIGHNPQMPSRNRTVLISLVREMQSPFATRFELRSPNPSSNTYLLTAASYCAMMDGMEYSMGKDAPSLLEELSKPYGKVYPYLDDECIYRCEDDMYRDFTQEERDKYFSPSPATVRQVITYFTDEHRKMLTCKGVFTDDIIDSYLELIKSLWLTELRGRIIPDHRKNLRTIYAHLAQAENQLDQARYQEIVRRIKHLMKDNDDFTCQFSKLLEHIAKDELEEVSCLQLKIKEEIHQLDELFHEYRDNIIENPSHHD